MTDEMLHLLLLLLLLLLVMLLLLSQKPIFKVWFKWGQEQLRSEILMTLSFWWWWCKVIFMSNLTFESSWGWVGVVIIEYRMNLQAAVTVPRGWSSDYIASRPCERQPSGAPHVHDHANINDILILPHNRVILDEYNSVKPVHLIIPQITVLPSSTKPKPQLCWA